MRVMLVLALIATTSSSILSSFKMNVRMSNVTVFNAFASQEAFATVTFGKSVQNQMNQIGYGSYKTAALSSNSEDFVVQFMKLPTGGNGCAIGPLL